MYVMIMKNKITQSLSNIFLQLKSCESGLAVIEFAYSLPIFTLLGFTGTEIANLAVVNTRVSQISTTLADNLSRSKAGVPLDPPELREVDIDDALLGARIQGGTSVSILEKGRIVVSSLQVNSSNRQTIKWQRCKGMLNLAGPFGNGVGRYGIEGTTQPSTGTGGFQGMGPGAHDTRVKAQTGTAIIFVEVTYQHTPTVGTTLAGPWNLRKEAAFYVRDDRSLNSPVNPAPASGVSACNEFNTTF
jgi:hypothetical protein